MHARMASGILDEEGKRRLPFDLLNLKIDEREKTISCELRLPSKFPSRYDCKEKNVRVNLDLKSDSVDEIRCCEMMMEISHPTILKARAVMEVESHLLLWVEPYKGNLLDYLRYALGGPLKPRANFTLIQTQVLQAEVLRKIVRQIIEGLEHLMTYGYYHGNFTMLNTYYNETNSEILVKLTNFRKKSEWKSLCQWGVVALGTELKTLSSIADERNREHKKLIFDITLLDDLALKLKNLPKHNLVRSYAKIKTHVYFWETYHRKKFFVYFVSLKMKNKEVKSEVDKCEDLCKKLPWNHRDYNGFLQKMNQFRAKRKKRPYNGNKRSDLVSFICALYTHEHEPELRNCGTKVDEVITRIHPYMCLILSDLLESSKEHWL